jgi:hypothetical protein
MYMYKPSKVKHPSVKTYGKKKKGEPAYASSASTPTGPESSRDYAPADEADYAEATISRSATTEAPAHKPAAAESTTDEPTPVATAQEPQAETRTSEETHKPVLNEDEQKKVVNQPASSAATNDKLEEY